jgi:hypothetical protein
MTMSDYDLLALGFIAGFGVGGLTMIAYFVRPWRRNDDAVAGSATPTKEEQ